MDQIVRQDIGQSHAVTFFGCKLCHLMLAFTFTHLSMGLRPLTETMILTEHGQNLIAFSLARPLAPPPYGFINIFAAQFIADAPIPIRPLAMLPTFMLPITYAPPGRNPNDHNASKPT